MARGCKEGEAPVARELIKKIAPSLEKGYFSADAGIACREFTTTIEESGHDFIAVIKGNAGKIHDEMKFLPWKDAHSWFSAEKGHGRRDVNAG